LDHDVTLLIHAGRLHADDALVGTRFRLTGLEDLALRVDRVALEDRTGQRHLFPAEIRHAVDGEINDRLAGDQRQREARVHERLLEFSVARLLRVEVDRIRAHRQTRKPHAVGLRDGAAERMLVDIADDEVLEDVAGPAWLDWHQIVPSARQAAMAPAPKPNSLRIASVCSPSAGTGPMCISEPLRLTGGSSA